MRIDNVINWINCDKVEIKLYGNDGHDNQEIITGQKAKDIFIEELKTAINLDMEEK